MYKGKRDDHISIRVPQGNCYEYTSSGGEPYIEIVVPVGGNEPYQWSSIMVRPDQVCYDHIDPDKYNIIEYLNRSTRLKLAKKQAVQNGRTIISIDTVTPMQLLAYFEFCN